MPIDRMRRDRNDLPALIAGALRSAEVHADDRVTRGQHSGSSLVKWTKHATQRQRIVVLHRSPKVYAGFSLAWPSSHSTQYVPIPLKQRTWAGFPQWQVMIGNILAGLEAATSGSWRRRPGGRRRSSRPGDGACRADET